MSEPGLRGPHRLNAASPVEQQALQFVDFVQRVWLSVAVANAENSNRMVITHPNEGGQTC